MGPTASGKTDLAIALQEHLPVELINVDSAQIYRQLDIGSAKPDKATLAVAPHRLINILDPLESYSAADFITDATREMAEISSRGKIPLLVGGTMLYFKALLEGLSDMPPADADIRAEILKHAQDFGWASVHEQLRAVDPESAASLHPNHSQRIQRALEVYRISGVPMSLLRSEPNVGSVAQSYNIKQIALLPNNRKLIHRRIDIRFRKMMEAGFEAEVRALFQRGDLHADLPAIRSVGYRQIWQYLQGQCSLDEAVEKGIIATRQLAKRQITWLRNWPSSCEIQVDNETELLSINNICQLALKKLPVAPIYSRNMES
ncbi:tRNA (adenosine(37)-N6)-dimethylallyltransferase MiaA [SAR92 clade bacterium H455]|uniref:tRNA dimethylallyltransferase n=1 Tax=SAR92 clade bacterium H455 TaxID=2974818 RepID=A0ABY5TSN9_9GAMM|nr:tRNA (adenosine(37)-N6)-dimethylallyltransferase MiaA [SAR92 clade bacterium H455]